MRRRVPEPGTASYDDIRGKLRERGYLDGGLVQRLLLRDLLSKRGGLAVLPRTAFKAALIGGPLIGALLAGAAAVANRPLLGGADLALMWLWFSLVSGAALFVLDLTAASIVAGLARRRGARTGDSGRAALLVGLPTLIYLVALWLTRHPSAGLGADLLFGALAVPITLIVARLAGLVSLTAIVRRTGDVPERGRRAVGLWILALVAAAAALMAARTLGDRPDATIQASPFEVRASAGRLLVVGVDGLDAALVEVLEPSGAVDRTLEGMGRSSVFPLSRRADAEPPEAWTTLMTGVESELHGVIGAGVETLPGVRTPLRGEAGPLALSGALRFLLPTRTVPTSAVGRRHRALWEIVSLRRPVVAVGWWSSWPAREAGQGGFVVTDRVLPKLGQGATADRDTAPAALYARLQSDFPADRAELQEMFQSEFRSLQPGPTRELVWESFLIDAYSWRVTRRLMADGQVAAAFVYLPGFEILRHRLAGRTDGGVVTELLELQRALERYAFWLDRLLDEALHAPDWQTMVIGDPGRGTAPGSEGLLIVRSGAATAGCIGPTVGPLDVAPLALALMGFPQSDELTGRPPAECVDLSSSSTIASYGRRESGTELPTSDYDEEMLERLKSLGYLN